MKHVMLRVGILYVAVLLVLFVDTWFFAPHTFQSFVNRGALVGIGGIFVLLFMNRSGISVDDAMSSSSHDDLTRAARRRWFYAAVIVAILLLLTAVVLQYMIWRS
ncbi:hypothetical protein [Ferroacidibacillus organovorans]|uniref:Uncharacterized protein n=1 Tax=Ferroacidibacillus organovorans TaxID=1765683 RepID=A0A124IVY8_9BACL|nr:hypothetical protein [Ferroacidibacillus organovorans]KUO95750.1 hypothetical protein ATW55_05300 [Ferroacidibacillus organovorans]